ncbi:MAG: hypothetical protein KC940_22510, partial [Candidatus Omnitrophica bacterium]|nr:hypothetical protein [Candidatus Omnitrophota bacterium]
MLTQRRFGLRTKILLSSFVFGGATVCGAIEESKTSGEFISRVSEVLPVEDRYEYHQQLKTGSVHDVRRDPNAQATSDEMTIPAKDWRLIIHEDADPLVRYAAEDLKAFLKSSMEVTVEKISEDSLDSWGSWSNVIVAGTKDQLPGLGQDLRGPKDYEIQVTPDRIVVCGFDASGVRFGLFNLEERMSLREGPFLPRDLHTVRHSLYQTRMVLSWLGWMEWPDSYLSHLAHDGYDAIFASVYANPNGVEG